MLRIPCLVALSLAVVFPNSVPNISASAATVRTVALEGQQAPGLLSGVRFDYFNPPVINAAGHTAFVSNLTGDRIIGATDLALWSEGSGSLALVAREWNQAPGAPTGVNYDDFYTPVLNGAGQIAFIALLQTGIRSGVWSGHAENLRLVALAGDRAPGVPDGRVFRGFVFDSLRLNSAGEIAFEGAVTGEGEGQGIWSERAGELMLIARSGMHAPGAPTGKVYETFFGPVLNGAGQTVFGASLDGPYRGGIWSERSGTLALVALQGEQAPGLPSGVNYAGFGNNLPVLNSAGQIAFRADLTGVGVDSTNKEGLWSGQTGNLKLVARSGDRAPGTPDGVYFGSRSFWPVVLNARGQTAFDAELTGIGVDDTNDHGIWSEGSGNLELVAREGSRAPGTPDGVQFGRIYGLPAPTLNAAGQVAFAAWLAGSGITDSNDLGIWATDVNGTLQLIAREGERLEVAPSDFRTIGSLRFIQLNTIVGSGNEDGRPSGFNDRGQLAFTASFTDGSSGVFVSNVVAIPEPATLVLVGIAFFGAMNTRRCVRKTGGQK